MTPGRATTPRGHQTQGETMPKGMLKPITKNRSTCHMSPGCDQSWSGHCPPKPSIPSAQGTHLGKASNQ